MDRLYISLQILSKRIKFEYSNIINNTLLKVVSLFKNHNRNSLAVILYVFFHVAVFLVNSYLVSPSASFLCFNFNSLYFEHSYNLKIRDLRIQVSWISATSSGLLPPPPSSSSPENNISPSGLKLWEPQIFHCDSLSWQYSAIIPHTLRPSK